MDGETVPFGGRLWCLWGPFPGVKTHYAPFQQHDIPWQRQR
jgi:hypothetical protein